MCRIIRIFFSEVCLLRPPYLDFQNRLYIHLVLVTNHNFQIVFFDFSFFFQSNAHDQQPKRFLLFKSWIVTETIPNSYPKLVKSFLRQQHLCNRNFSPFNASRMLSTTCKNRIILISFKSRQLFYCWFGLQLRGSSWGGEIDSQKNSFGVVHAISSISFSRSSR